MTQNSTNAVTILGHTNGKYCKLVIQPFPHFGFARDELKV